MTLEESVQQDELFLVLFVDGVEFLLHEPDDVQEAGDDEQESPELKVLHLDDVVDRCASGRSKEYVRHALDGGRDARIVSYGRRGGCDRRFRDAFETA